MNFSKYINVLPIGEFHIRTILGVLLSIILTACQTPSNSREMILDMAAESGFSEIRFKSEGIPFFSVINFKKSSTALRIYIEGDGRTWITRYRPAIDPSPANPIALKLALMDTSEINIAYLARPCQFSKHVSPKKCPQRIWTKDQYRESTIFSINAAITTLKEQSKAQQIELIGFSGGGTIALLIAARRDDIANIRTIAGNLNPNDFTHYHGVSKLEHSLNPLNYMAALKNIPQIHFISLNDKIVPASIPESYFHQINGGNCIQLVYVNNTSHLKGWEEKWKDLQVQPISCNLTKPLQINKYL